MNTQMKISKTVLFLLLFGMGPLNKHGFTQAEFDTPDPSEELVWHRIGPFDPTGNIYDNLGQVNVIKFHPEYSGTYAKGELPTTIADFNKNTIYAGSAPGGLFYSRDGGKYWHSYGVDDLLYSGCSDFEIATYYDKGGKAKRDFYYVHSPFATGYNSSPTWHFASVVYKRSEGSDWSDVNAPFDYSNAQISGTDETHLELPIGINDLAIAPGDGELPSDYKVYVASNVLPGFHYSVDKGATWEAADFDDPDYLNNANWYNGPQHIMVDRADNDKVYLSSGRGAYFPAWSDPENDDASLVFRSIDGGANFEKWLTVNKGDDNNNGLTLSSAPSPASETDKFRIREVELFQAKSDPDRLYLKVFTETLDGFDETTGPDRVYSDGGGVSVFTSYDHGTTWEYGNKMTTAGPYLNVFSMAIDPVNPDRVYIGRGNGAYCPSDGKRQMMSMYDHVTRTFVICTNSRFHPDLRCMDTKNIDGNTHLIAGHDGGVAFSDDMLELTTTDAGNSFESRTGSLVFNRHYAHSLSRMEAGKIRTPMPDNGIMESTLEADGVRPWHIIQYGDGEHSQMSANPDDDDVSTVISSGGSTQIEISIRGCAMDKIPRIDGNNVNGYASGVYNWHQFPMKWIAWDTPDYLPEYKAFLAQSDAGSDVYRMLYSPEDGCGDYIDLGGLHGDDGSLIKSRIEELEVHPDLPGLVIFSYLNSKPTLPHNSRIAYGYVSEEGDVMWQLFNHPDSELPSDAPITGLEITRSPVHSEGSYKLFVSFRDGKVASAFYNAGSMTISKWKDESTGLPDTPVNCLAFNQETNRLFAGTDRGVYVRSTIKVFGDAGPYDVLSWTYLGSGLPNVPVMDLELEGGIEGAIYASTWGRGIYQFGETGGAEPLDDLKKGGKEKRPVPITSTTGEMHTNGIKVYPNPVSSGEMANIVLNLLEEDVVTLELYNEDGKKINTIVEGQRLAKGRHIRSVNVGREGFILVRALIGEEIFTEKIIVTTLSDRSVKKNEGK